MKIEKYLASDYAVLDSNVHTGGGTDDTAALQAILDRADENHGVHLVIDGAALITKLILHSNTTIECLTKDCGFYQIGHTDDAMITNSNWNNYHLKTRNITLLGGTYNQNCREQHHDCKYEDLNELRMMNFNLAIEFYGVENLLVRGITIAQFRTFAFTVGCFRNVTIENVWFDMKHHMMGNQDGFHFWGPGQYLTVKNSGGCVSDDIMNIGPDERDCFSDITDVLVDGLFLDDAEQAVRLLTRGTGRLDRCTIRNITGQYRSFGFYINPWFPDVTHGNFGNILIENVHLKEHPRTYPYRNPMLFAIGGNVEHLSMKNIRHSGGNDPRTLFEIGLPFYSNTDYKITPDCPAHGQKLQTIEIDGFTVTEDTSAPEGREYIQLFDRVENFILKNVFVLKEQEKKNGTLIAMHEMGGIGNLITESVYTKGLETLCNAPEKIENRMTAEKI